MLRLIHCFLAAMALTSVAVGQSSTVDYCNRIPLSSGETELAVEDQFYTSVLAGSYDGPHAIDREELTLRLWFEESDRRAFDQAFDVSVTCDLHLTYVDGSTETLVGEQLSIFYTLTGQYIDMDVFHKTDVITMQVEVTNVDVTGTTLTNLTDVFLEACIHSEKYLPLSDEILEVGFSPVETTNEIEYHWTPVEGATGYDIEWYHYGWGTNGAVDLQGEADLDWHDAGRLRVSQNWYRMSRAFPAGRLFFRVRAVGRDVQTGWAAEGPWSCGEVNVFDLSTGQGAVTSIDFEGFENDRSWAYQARFAENGMKAETVTFADGTGRIRQSVRFNPEQKIALVQSQTYDYYGRGTLHPLPSVEPSEGVGYYPAQLRNQADQLYSYQDYDLPGTVFEPNQLAHTPGDVNSTGPGHYWGGADDNPGVHSSVTPDAQGYAFTRGILLADGSGRVKQQSGNGETFRMSNGSTRMTTHLYGSVSQAELDRLFGLEAGDASHYKKHITIDVDGEASAVITDQKGRTVASYLTGDPSAGMLELDHMVGVDGVPITADLTPFNNTSGDHRSLSYTIANAVTTTYDFQYQLDDTDPVLGDCAYSGACVYEVQIRVLNEFGIPQPILVLGTPTYFELEQEGTLLRATNVFAVEGDPSSALVDFQVTLDQVGTYTVEKNLEVYDLENRLAEYESQLSLCSPEPIYQELTCGDCATDCVDSYLILEAIEDGAGFTVHSTFSSDTWNPEGNYVAVGTASAPLLAPSLGDVEVAPFDMGQVSFSTAFTDAGALSELADALDNCIAECVNFNISEHLDFCEVYRHELFEDLSPEGQYFEATAQMEAWDYTPNMWMEAHALLPANTSSFDDLRANWESISAGWSNVDQQDWLRNHPDYLMFDLYCVAKPIETVVSAFDKDDPKTALIETLTSMDYPTDAFDAFYDFSIGASAHETHSWEVTDPFPGFANPLNMAGQTDGPPSLYLPFGSYNFDGDYSLANFEACAAEGFDVWLLTSPEFYVHQPTYSALTEVGDTWVYDSERVDALDGLVSQDVDVLPIHQLQEALRRFVWITNADNITDKASIWYLIDNPDVIGAGNENFSDETNALFDQFHAPAEGDDPGGLFVRSPEEGGMSKWQFFRGVYLFHRQMAVDAVAFWNQYQGIANCTMPLFSDCGVAPQPTEAGEFLPSLLTQEGYEVRLPRNPLITNLISAMSSSLPLPGSGVTYPGLQVPFWNLPEQLEDGLVDLEFDNVDGTMCAQVAVQAAQDYVEGHPELFGYPGDADAPYSQDDLDAMYGILFDLASDGSACQESGVDLLLIDLEGLINDALSLGGFALFTPPVNPNSYQVCGCSNLNFSLQEYMELELEGDQTPSSSWSAWWTGTTSDQQLAFVDHLNSTFDAALDISMLDGWSLVCDGSVPESTLVGLPNDLGCMPNAEAEFPTDQELCGTSLSDVEFYAAYAAYQEEVEQKILDYQDLYVDACFSGIEAREVFLMSHDLRDYQYTLFYFDQADNLIKTIPAKGVHPLTDPALIAAVEESRGSEEMGLSSDLWPQHSFVTQKTYRSTQAMTSATTPDGGTIQFFYDELGREVATQDAQQAHEGAVYRYKLFDPLGRLIEAGEIVGSGLFNQGDDIAAYVATQAIERHDVVKYFFDEPYADLPFTLKNGRNKLCVVVYADFVSGNAPAEDDITSATYFSYDIHGNVTDTWQYNGLVSIPGQAYKHVMYEYDILNGEVEYVHYQPGEWDQFHHRYFYDESNYIKEVFTSRDGIVWDRDAKYAYRADGGLARTEIGEKKVQGVDVAYNLWGWIKGINSNTLRSTDDLGQDALDISLNRSFADDAYGVGVHYFDGDHLTVGNSNWQRSLDNTPDGGWNPQDLYNGNFTRKVTAQHPSLALDGGGQPSALVHHFRYDRLNRIKEYRTAQVATGEGMAEEPYADLTTTQAFASEYSYDANGNITSLQRKDVTGAIMDALVYRYSGTADALTILDEYGTCVDLPLNNRLMNVLDSGMAGDLGDFADDYDDDGATCDPDYKYDYIYDRVGNIIQDNNDGILEIVWNQSGRIVSMRMAEDQSDVEFTYNPQGHRIGKTIKPKFEDGTLKPASFWTHTVYVKDPFGTDLAIYDLYQVHDQNDEPELVILELEGHYLLGSKRLGMRSSNAFVQQDLDAATVNASVLASNRIVGTKQYELYDEGQNVMAVVTDRKLGNGYDDGYWVNYSPEISTARDYYPFGVEMYAKGMAEDDYRYGFNGMERDNEVKPDGNSLDFGARFYDPRLGRWMSTDALQHRYPGYSPYGFALNNPVYYLDPDGKKVYPVFKNKEHEKRWNAVMNLLSYSEVFALNFEIVDKESTYDAAGNELAHVVEIRAMTEEEEKARVEIKFENGVFSYKGVLGLCSSNIGYSVSPNGGEDCSCETDICVEVFSEISFAFESIDQINDVLQRDDSWTKDYAIMSEEIFHSGQNVYYRLEGCSPEVIGLQIETEAKLAKTKAFVQTIVQGYTPEDAIAEMKNAGFTDDEISLAFDMQSEEYTALGEEWLGGEKSLTDEEYRQILIDFSEKLKTTTYKQYKDQTYNGETPYLDYLEKEVESGQN